MRGVGFGVRYEAPTYETYLQNSVAANCEKHVPLKLLMLLEVLHGSKINFNDFPARTLISLAPIIWINSNNSYPNMLGWSFAASSDLVRLNRQAVTAICTANTVLYSLAAARTNCKRNYWQIFSL